MIKNIWLLSLSLILSATALLANGSRLPSQDNFVVSRGYATAASPDRPSAVYYNPAGLALQERTAFLNTVHVIAPSYELTQGGNSTDAKDQVFAQPSFFATLPYTNNEIPITFGFGFYSPFGLSTDWPTNSSFRTLATRNEVQYLTAAFAVGLSVADNLHVGVGFELNHNKTELNRGLGLTPNDRFTFKGTDIAPTWTVGLLWEVNEKHSFGFMYRSACKFTLDGDASISPLNLSNDARVNWVYPDNFVIGYAYRPSPNWLIGLDYDYTNWERVNTLQLNAGPLSTSLPLNWKASSYTNLGVTYFTGPWSYSAGISYSTNSIPDSTLSPALPDNDKFLYNVGVGYTWRQWEFTTVFQVSPTNKRVISGQPAGPTGESANGTYKSSLLALGVSVGYHW